MRYDQQHIRSRRWRNFAEKTRKVRGNRCAICGTVGEMHLDHRIPRSLGGTDDPNNLQLLCASCHSAKTARQEGGFGNRPSSKPAKACDASGNPLDASHWWNRRS